MNEQEQDKEENIQHKDEKAPQSQGVKRAELL